MANVTIVPINTLQSLKLKDVKAILKRTGHSFTTENVLSSEAEVFRVVGYKVNIGIKL